MKTTIEISDPLLREAKQVAHRAGLTLRELVEDGLRYVLDQRGRRKAFKLPDRSFKGGAGLQPGIREDDWRQIKALARGHRAGYPEDLDELDRFLEALYGEGDR